MWLIPNGMGRATSHRRPRHGAEKGEWKDEDEDRRASKGLLPRAAAAATIAPNQSKNPTRRRPWPATPF